jgi:hypothetical protein
MGLAPGALGGGAQCVGEEGARQPGKSPEKEPEPRIFLTSQAGSALQAVRKPQRGGCHGGALASPISLSETW